MRVKATISYDGSSFLGFQKQKSTTNTITYAIEKALKSLKIDSDITGSGRTDAGVHATGQVIHFDLPTYWSDLKKLQLNLNRKLEKISFKSIKLVDNNFHARFNAKKRVYRYIFKTSKPSVFENNYISYYQEFDTKNLNNSLKLFRGEHDFNMFHKTGSQMHTTKREIFHTRYFYKNGYHFIYITANGFLRSQVRMIVDAAIKCSRAELTTLQLKEQIENSVKHTTKLAPPQGLYLAKVIY